MFAKRLRKLRESKGWTQEDVAKKLKTSRSTVGDYETGRKMPKYDRLAQIANLFDVSIDYLLGHDEKDKDKKDNNIIDILEEIKKRPYVIDPKTGRIRQIPERKAKIIADIIEDFLREEGKLPPEKHNEDCQSSI